MLKYYIKKNLFYYLNIKASENHHNHYEKLQFRDRGTTCIYKDLWHAVPL